MGPSQTAEDAVPSELSGGEVRVPIWKSFVGNKDFQERQAGAIAAEKSIMASAGRGGVKWGGDNGRLFRKSGSSIEEFDAEQLAEDPEAGPFARKSLFDRERRSAAAEYDGYDLRLQDPSFKARGLTEKARQERQFEFEALPDTDPRKAQAKAAIDADDQYRAEKAEIERRKYEAKVRATQLGNLDPDSWWANRAAIGQARKPAPVEQAQAARGEAKAADDSAMGREKELDAELMSGVSATRLAEIKAEKAEIAQARSMAGEQQVEAEKKIEEVKGEAKKEFFRFDDTISGIWDAVKGLGVTAPAAFYQLVEGLDRPDQYSESAKQAFAEADAYAKEMEAKTAANQAAGTSSSVGESFREVGPSLGFSLGSMAAAIPAGIAGSKAGAAVGAGIGAAAGAPAAGVGAVPGAGAGAAIGGVIGGAGAAMAASGAAAYRMAGASFLNEAFQTLEAESARKSGRPMNEEEKASAYEALLPIAKNTALWEAGPEAVGNAVALGAGKIVFGLGKPLMTRFMVTTGGKIATKAGAAAASVGTELATETLTQVEQSADQKKMMAIAEGQDPDAIVANWSAGGVVDAFKEVAPQTLAMLTLMGGAAGGVKVALKGADALTKDSVDKGRASVIDQTTAALASIDPEAAPPTPQEIGDAVFITGVGAGVEGLAESVVIERELAGIDAEDTAAVDAADKAVADAKATGDAATIKAAETARESVIGGRAHLVRAVLKIASGRDISELTDNELRSIGYKADKEKPGEYVELDADEAKAAGITKPMVRRGADESVVITDEALKRVEGILPRARARVKMGETEALDKAQQRANTPEWEVDTSAGPVRVRAKSPEDAERIAAETSPLGQTVRPGSAKQVSPSPGSDSGNAPGGASPVNPAAGNQSSNETGKPQSQTAAPANQAGAQGNPAGASGGTAGSAKPAAKPGEKALAAAQKRFEQIKKKLGDRIVWGSRRANTTPEGIEINPQQIVAEAIAGGMNEAQAAQYFARVLDEEVRHLAQYDAMRKLWEAAGSPDTMAGWADRHYAGIWQTDFVATGKDKIVFDIYAKGNPKAEAAWKTKSDAAKAMEAIRMMSQGDKITEAGKLWVNISDTLRQAIEAALAALKEFIDIASPTLKTEIQNLENALKQLNKPRGGTSKAGGKKPASGQAGAGTGGAAPQGGNSSPDSNGGTQPPPSNGAGAPLSVGARVSFIATEEMSSVSDRAGQRIEGVVALIQNGSARIRPDFDPSISVRVAVDELTVEQAAKPQEKPASNELGEGLEAAPLPETDANIGRLRSRIQGGMNKPLLDEARRQQAAFGNISTPRLANPGNTARSRAEQDIVDALYEHERQVRKDRDVFAEARRRVNDDPKGVEEKLLQIAEGKTFATDDADHVAFDMLINQRAAEAGNDLTKHEANMALRMAYRAMRADTARELRIGYDKFMKPEERARKEISDAIYTPTLAIEKRAAQLNFSPEKQREYIRQAASERLQTIEKALKKMGVTLDEILSGQAFLSLSQNAILKQALAVRTAEERMVVKMLQAKTPLERIKKKTGFTEERIEGIRAMLYEELLEKAKEKVRAGMKLENFKDAMKGLQAADLPGAGMTEEQIEAEARRIVEIGFGIPLETPKASVAKPKRIKPKADTDPHQADWTRPVFTDGLNDYDFDTKDRAEIMKRVEAIRGIASATGKINTLTGKKKAQAEALLKEIDAILAKYGTDSEKIFEAAKPVEEYAFNIHDRAHVAAIARAIQAIDADIVDKGLEWVYSSILSGIQTMTVNATAAIPAAWDMTVGRGFEMAVNALFRDKNAATPNEVKYILKAARPALARAMSNASATWSSELPMFDEDFLGKAADLDKLFDGHAPKIGVIGGTKGRIIRVPIRILLATDEFNRTAIAVAEVGAMAYRVAQAQGLKPGTPEFDKFLAKEVNTAGSYSAKLAAEKASKLIFTNPLPGQTNPITDERAPIEGIGDVVGAGAALLNSLVTTKTDNLFAKALLAILRVSFFPFQRTPFNLIRRGVRHTLNPISLIDIAVLMTKNSITVDTNGKIRWKWNARGRNPEIVVRLAQQLQGATLLAALMAMAAGEGDEDDQDKPILITGSQPFTLKGMAEREAQMRSGLGPYRISFRRKDGFERFGFNYGRLEPLATTLGTTIDSIKAYKRTNRAGADGAGVASSVLGGLVAQAQDKTYLQGFADLFSLVNNALESDESLKDNRKFQQFMASRVAMAFPNIIKQPIREADPMYRARAEDFMQELLYQAVPYGQKEAKADPYGRLAEKTGNPVGRMFDVTDAGTDPVNPYDKALLRWRDSGQGKPWFPAPIVSGSFKNARTGKEQDMTQEQLAEFRDIAGKRVTAMLKREAINLEKPTIIDIEKIKDAHSKARSEAKKMIAYKHSR